MTLVLAHVKHDCKLYGHWKAASGSCWLCEGGLTACGVCGQAEADLEDDCPGPCKRCGMAFSAHDFDPANHGCAKFERGRGQEAFVAAAEAGACSQAKLNEIYGKLGAPKACENQATDVTHCRKCAGLSEMRALEIESLRKTVALLRQWTLTFGTSLKPPRADTYGEGMRDAKKQVERILFRTEGK